MSESRKEEFAYGYVYKSQWIGNFNEPGFSKYINTEEWLCCHCGAKDSGTIEGLKRHWQKIHLTKSFDIEERA